MEKVATSVEKLSLNQDEEDLDVDDVLELHSDKEDDPLWDQEERGDGDGQEEKESKVDDDEDRRNPQYIPKKVA